MKAGGYRILRLNYRCRYAEIDLVAMDGDTLVFVEVKYRRSLEEGDPLEAVDAKKQRRISRAALSYISEHRCEEINFRFDVVGVTGKEIALVKNAFEFVG